MGIYSVVHHWVKGRARERTSGRACQPNQARNSTARVAAQIGTGHWRTAVFLRRIGKRGDDRCWFCSTVRRMIEIPPLQQYAPRRSPQRGLRAAPAREHPGPPRGRPVFGIIRSWPRGMIDRVNEERPGRTRKIASPYLFLCPELCAQQRNAEVEERLFGTVRESDVQRTQGSLRYRYISEMDPRIRFANGRTGHRNLSSVT